MLASAFQPTLFSQYSGCYSTAPFPFYTATQPWLPFVSSVYTGTAVIQAGRRSTVVWWARLHLCVSSVRCSLPAASYHRSTRRLVVPSGSQWCYSAVYAACLSSLTHSTVRLRLRQSCSDFRAPRYLVYVDKVEPRNTDRSPRSSRQYGNALLLLESVVNRWNKLEQTDIDRGSQRHTAWRKAIGKGERYLASGRQYGNALLRVRFATKKYY